MDCRVKPGNDEGGAARPFKKVVEGRATDAPGARRDRPSDCFPDIARVYAIG